MLGSASPEESVGVRVDCVTWRLCVCFISAGNPGNGECVDYKIITVNFQYLMHAEWNDCISHQAKGNTNKRIHKALRFHSSNGNIYKPLIVELHLGKS